MSKGFPFSVPKKHILKLSHTNFTMFMLLHQTFQSLRQQTDQSAAVNQKLVRLSESEHECIHPNACTYTILRSKVDFYAKYFCCICLYVTLLCKVVEKM